MIQGTNRSQNQPNEDPKNRPQNEGVSQLKNQPKKRPKTGPETDPQIDPKARPHELPAQAPLTQLSLPFTTPKVLSDSNGRLFVSFYFHGKRHRFYSGAILGLPLRPNSNTCTDPLTTAQQLSAVFYGKLLSGWSPEKAGQKREEQRLEKREHLEQREPKASPGLPLASSSTCSYATLSPQNTTPSSNLHRAIDGFTAPPHLSEKYRSELATTKKLFLQMLRAAGYGLMKVSELDIQHVKGFLSQFESPSSYNHHRQQLSVILRPTFEAAGLESPALKTKKRKTTATLHEPFPCVVTVLEEVEKFNEHLHLCCLLTYGCLLRPHNEIRQLTWGDFKDDFSEVRLSGERNKSGKVRVVPVPGYVKEKLRHGRALPQDENIFSGRVKPYGGGYFKGLWTKFKAHSELVLKKQTLYSFRHTAALHLFESTGDIKKLSLAMGHSSLEVTLNYLRHMARTELTEKDMPQLQGPSSSRFTA